MPEPGGTGAQVIPEIEDADPVVLEDIFELIMTIVEPETWDRQGVSLEEIVLGGNGVIHVPEVHEKIATTLERIENIASRRVEVEVSPRPN